MPHLFFWVNRWNYERVLLNIPRLLFWVNRWNYERVLFNTTPTLLSKSLKLWTCAVQYTTPIILSKSLKLRMCAAQYTTILLSKSLKLRMCAAQYTMPIISKFNEKFQSIDLPNVSTIIIILVSHLVHLPKLIIHLHVHVQTCQYLISASSYQLIPPCHLCMHLLVIAQGQLQTLRNLP